MATYSGSSKNNTKSGTNGKDTFNYGQGGNDTLKGKDGEDLFNLGAKFNANDRINGGGDVDALKIAGNYAAGVVFNATTLVGVEAISLGAGFSYRFTTHNATVAAGQLLGIDARALEASKTLTINGAAETDGSFAILANHAKLKVTLGAKADSVIAGNGDSTIKLGNGANFAQLGDGDNQITAGKDVDTIVLGTGDNIVSLGGGGDFLTVGDSTTGGNNTIDLGSGANIATLGTGNDKVTAGSGDDIIVDFGGTNVFNLQAGGTDMVASSGAGKDTYKMGANFDLTDVIADGGGNGDTLSLDGDYSAGLSLTVDQVSGIDRFVFAKGHDYRITVDDSVVLAFSGLTVDARALRGTDGVIFDGSAEADAPFLFQSGGGQDKFTGGVMNDTFSYLDIPLVGERHDILTGFSFISDFIKFREVDAIDATVASGKLRSGSNFDGDLAAALSGHLGEGHAILFTPTTGTAAYVGKTFLIVDSGTDGAGYQGGKDLVVRLHDPGNIGNITVGDFIA